MSRFEVGDKVRVVGKGLTRLGCVGVIITFLGPYLVRGDSFEEWFSERDLDLIRVGK